MGFTERFLKNRVSGLQDRIRRLTVDLERGNASVAGEIERLTGDLVVAETELAEWVAA